MLGKSDGAEYISYLIDMSGQETLMVIFSTNNIPVFSYGPHPDKTCLPGFRQSDIQISLLSYKDKLEH